MHRTATLCFALAFASPLLAQAPAVHGITCDAGEGQRIHIHQRLTIFKRGVPVPVPAQIGIPLMTPCIYWLHTHTPDGIIHVEAPQDRSFTLGDFFAIWGRPLDKSHAVEGLAPGDSMRVWVDGKVYRGDPATIALKAHTDITIQLGPPYTKPAPFTNWGRL